MVMIGWESHAPLRGKGAIIIESKLFGDEAFEVEDVMLNVVSLN